MKTARKPNPQKQEEQESSLRTGTANNLAKVAALFVKDRQFHNEL